MHFRWAEEILSSNIADEVLGIGMLGHHQKMTTLAYQPFGIMRVHAHKREFLNCLCRAFALPNAFPKARSSLYRAGCPPVAEHCLPSQHAP